MNGKKAKELRRLVNNMIPDVPSKELIAKHIIKKLKKAINKKP